MRIEKKQLGPINSKEPSEAKRKAKDKGRGGKAHAGNSLAHAYQHGGISHEERQDDAAKV